MFHRKALLIYNPSTHLFSRQFYRVNTDFARFIHDAKTEDALKCPLPPIFDKPVLDTCQ